MLTSAVRVAMYCSEQRMQDHSWALEMTAVVDAVRLGSYFEANITDASAMNALSSYAPRGISLATIRVCGPRHQWNKLSATWVVVYFHVRHLSVYRNNKYLRTQAGQQDGEGLDCW